MEWSKFNFVYKSEKHECFFLYNSRTNSFIKISERLYEAFIKKKNVRLKSLASEFKLDENTMNTLLKAKVFVMPGDDANFLTQKKMAKYKRSFQTKVLGLVILPTYACNFKCPYCYESNLPDIFMNNKVEDQILSFVKSLDGRSNIQLCWHGGEPLLAFKNIKSILTKIGNDKDLKLSQHAMVSNGYLIDKDKCLFLKEYNLSTIQITVDGLKDSHNKSRIHKSGIATYDKILDNIETIFNYMPQCHVIVRMNVHAENEKDFPLLYSELKSRWGQENYSLDMRYAHDHNSGCKVECFKEKDRIFFAKKLYENHNIKDILFYPKAKIGGCSATYINSFVIDPQGDVYKCWVDVGRKDRKIGNIANRKFNSCLLSEYIVGTDMFTDKKCIDCILFPICDGGCNLKRLNYKLKGIPYDLCPIDIKNLGLLFDMFYEQQKSI